jgi:hypothetical protein
MNSYSKKRKQIKRANLITNKEEITAGLRKSVVAVLSNTDNYKGLVGNSDLISNIADSVFSSIYKKHGKFFTVRKGDTFDNMIENIMFNTQKVCQVEETKKQIMNAANIISSGTPETVTLDVIHANVTEKLDAGISKDLDFFESKFKNEVDSLVYAGSDMSLKSLPARKDLLYLDLILVAEGTNANKDHIPAEELKNRYLTLIGMPLVEEHEAQAIRGVFFDAKLVRIKSGKEKGSVKVVAKGGKLAVRARAYVYKSRFPREAYMLKDRQEKGLLRYSVELAFSKLGCGVCGKEFSVSDPYCEHLMLRHSVSDPSFCRIVKDIYFIGGAYTTNPAEKMAVSLDIFDMNDEDAKKSNKTGASCVISIDDTGKVAKNTNKINADGDLESSNPNGGQQMEFNYNSVEELLGSPEVNALIEAKASDIVEAERDAFETSLTELEENKTSYKTKIEELEATLKEVNTKLEEANLALASMEEEKAISDAILDLQTAGYSFDSDDEIKAFTEQIKNMSTEQAGFVIDMMKKTITATEDPTDVVADNDDEGPEQASDTEVVEEDDSLEASQNADVNASANKNQTLLSVRQDWDKRVNTLLDNS